MCLESLSMFLKEKINTSGEFVIKFDEFKLEASVKASKFLYLFLDRKPSEVEVF